MQEPAVIKTVLACTLKVQAVLGVSSFGEETHSAAVPHEIQHCLCEHTAQNTLVKVPPIVVRPAVHATQLQHWGWFEMEYDDPTPPGGGWFEMSGNLMKNGFNPLEPPGAGPRKRG